MKVNVRHDLLVELFNTLREKFTMSYRINFLKSNNFSVNLKLQNLLKLGLSGALRTTKS